MKESLAIILLIEIFMSCVAGQFGILCALQTCFLNPNNEVSNLDRMVVPMDVQILGLGGNSFRIINETDFQNLYNLTQVVLSDNTVEHIDDFSFRDNSKLMFLLLDNNRLTQINSNTFFGLSGLVALNLRDNSIEGTLETGTFKYLPNMSSIDLANNRITEVEDCAFCNATSLRLLDISNNLITRIHRDSFKGLNVLAVLLISNNRIASFDFTGLSGSAFIFDFRTSNNNWACTCNLHRQYQEYISTKPHVIVSCNPDMLCVTCSSPASLAGHSLNTLVEGNFTDCDLPTTVMPTTTVAMTTSASTTDKVTTMPHPTVDLQMTTRSINTPRPATPMFETTYSITDKQITSEVAGTDATESTNSITDKQITSEVAATDATESTNSITDKQITSEVAATDATESTNNKATLVSVTKAWIVVGVILTKLIYIL